MRSRRLTQAIAGSNDEVGRTADPPSKLKTWTEYTTMTEDKQCLQRVQRDTTEGRCLEEGCGKNMLDDCLFPRHMMSGVQWSRPEMNVSSQPTCRYTVTSVTIASYAEVLFQSSFSLCRSTCLTSMRHTTRWSWYGLGDEAHCVPRSTTPDTAQSERALVRLIDTSS